MSFLRIVGCAALGVAAVAAAPVTGGGSIAAAIAGFGVLTGVGAATGVIGGGLIGTIWESLSGDDQERLDAALENNAKLKVVLEKKVVETEELKQGLIKLAAALKKEKMENSNIRKILAATIKEKESDISVNEVIRLAA